MVERTCHTHTIATLKHHHTLLLLMVGIEGEVVFAIDLLLGNYHPEIIGTAIGYTFHECFGSLGLLTEREGGLGGIGGAPNKECSHPHPQQSE